MAVKKKKGSWLFPTNTNNLRMILAQGLLASPEGFSKYYQDVLLDYNGYLPLFNYKVSTASLEKAVSEAEHLVPCLLEFDLSKLSGQVNMLSNGEAKEVDLGSDLSLFEGDIEQLLIPLPLPLGCISKVIFKTKDDIEAFKKDAEIRSNVVLNKIKLSSTVAESKLFETTDADTLLVSNNTDSFEIEAPTIKPYYSAIYAYGGLLSLLFYYAKNGALSQRFFDDFSQNKIPQANNPKERAIPQFIYEYFHDDIDESRPENKILKGIVASCIESKDFKNSLLNFLRNSDWDDEKAGKRSYELADKLHDYVSNSSRSASEWFDNVKSDIEKVLLMLFTREDSDSLIDFHNPKINFSEREYLLFTMFFGIRDGFIKVPAFIREYNNLQEYISNKMAIYAHKQMSSNLTFKEINSPKTVWQFVNNKLSKANTKLLGLESCVQTIMPKANFKHEKGMNIYNGYHEPKYKIINEDYFQMISIKKVTNTEYNRLK